MIRAVLDANVLVSSLISPAGPPGQILDAWLEGRFRLFVSAPILEELRRILQYPRIRDRLGEGQITTLLEHLASEAELTKGELELDVLTRDPSDNAYLACAVEAQADALVTGISDHFAEAGGRYQGVSILSPRRFLELLEG